MPTIEFRYPLAEDVAALVVNMRQQDIDEVQALGHTDLHKVVADAVRDSTWCYAAIVDGQLAAIFGVAPFGSLIDSRGVPWMLGTPLVPLHRRTLTRYARPYIARMLAAYPSLINAVHAENTVAVRWLRRMGFQLQAPHRAGQKGELFHVFTMSR